MKKIRKLFFETEMTWKRVLIFAVATAVLTAAILIIPVTAATSAARIGQTLEAWILFALIIIMNCKSPLEAAIKTVVFFLVSQPLIYLLQVPFSSMGWKLFSYYPQWFKWTLLCFPGAIIAWLVKKKNIFSAVILSVATGFLAFTAVDDFYTLISVFPKCLISCVFCTVLSVGLIFVLLKEKKQRITAGVITLIVAVASAVVIFTGEVSGSSQGDYALDSSHSWEVVSVPENCDAHISDTDNTSLVYSLDKYGDYTIILRNELGEETELTITYNRSSGLTFTEE